MRLWHERFIPLLPKSQLLGQHRECCALGAMDGGEICKPYQDLTEVPISSPIYAEHNELYLEECRENLRQKNVFIQL